jgi:hypothetical protein
LKDKLLNFKRASLLLLTFKGVEAPIDFCKGAKWWDVVLDGWIGWGTDQAKHLIYFYYDLLSCFWGLNLHFSYQKGPFKKAVVNFQVGKGTSFNFSIGTKTQFLPKTALSRNG